VKDLSAEGFKANCGLSTKKPLLSEGLMLCVCEKKRGVEEVKPPQT
jgi:hypothetical protein